MEYTDQKIHIQTHTQRYENIKLCRKRKQTYKIDLCVYAETIPFIERCIVEIGLRNITSMKTTTIVKWQWHWMQWIWDTQKMRGGGSWWTKITHYFTTQKNYFFVAFIYFWRRKIDRFLLPQNHSPYVFPLGWKTRLLVVYL